MIQGKALSQSVKPSNVHYAALASTGFQDRCLGDCKQIRQYPECLQGVSCDLDAKAYKSAVFDLSAHTLSAV
jgi:hypothetical protein